MNSLENFNKTLLPNIGSFYNSLNLEIISRSDNNHAKNVWNTFEREILEDYQ